MVGNAGDAQSGNSATMAPANTTRTRNGAQTITTNGAATRATTAMTRGAAFTAKAKVAVSAPVVQVQLTAAGKIP